MGHSHIVTPGCGYLSEGLWAGWDPGAPRQHLGIWARSVWEEGGQGQRSPAPWGCPDCKGQGHTCARSALSSADHD